MPTTNLTPYFPRLLIEWEQETPDARYRELEGTLVFMDISGFTAMSERLARKGKVGAEEVTDVMSSTFARLLEAAYAQGAYLLKFGGDAMFLLFEGEEHVGRACSSAIHMRQALRDMGRFATSAGGVRLRMSVGVHTGTITFVLAGESHRELLVVGDAVTATARMEAAASAGQIAVSRATAELLPAACRGEPIGEGVLLRRAPAVHAPRSAPLAVDEFDGADRYVPVAVRAQLLAGIDESEHRMVTVAFVHFDGTDELLHERGPHAVAEMLDTLVRRAQSAAESFGICFLATDVDVDGGKIILAAGAPISGENDEERMLRAVRAIADDPGPLPVRIGVNRGAIFVGNVGPFYRRTYTVMGDGVNLAARLMAKAAPGKILTTREVLDRSRTVFQVEELPPLTLKGKAAPVTAYSVGAMVGTRGARELARLPLVGRERELAAMLEAFENLDAGTRLIEITGDAGIGKSRLVQELRERSIGAACLEAACGQYESSTPYYPFARLLRTALDIRREGDIAGQARRLHDSVASLAPSLLPWLPLLGAVLDIPVAETPESTDLQPAFRQRRLHRTIADLLRALLPRRSLLVIEDAHWMDDASRALLADLLASAADAPWLWCISRRGGASAVTVGDLPGVITIVLEPLPADEAARLTVIAAGGEALPQHELQALAARGAGNPLFLQELVASRLAGAGIAGLPDTIEALVVSRIDALPPAERRALRYAAVLGGSFERAWFSGSFAEMLDQEAAAQSWSSLDQFVTLEAGTVSFRHALVREVAYEALPFRLRRTLHQHAGDYFEGASAGHGDEHVELLSLHFSLAHDFEKAYRYSRLAGERSKAKWANIEAAEFFRRAIAAARQTSDADQGDLARLYEALGDVCEVAALYPDAMDAYGAARRTATNEGELLRDLLIREGVVRERIGRYPAALRWYGRALRESSPGDAAVRARIATGYAAVRFRQGKYADCASWCRRAIPDAEAGGNLASLAHAYYLLGHASTFLGSGEGPEFRRKALEIYEELGDLVGQANVLNNMGVAAHMYEGDWKRALHFFRRSRDARERAGDVMGAATASNNIGEILWEQGHRDEAIALFTSALDTWRAARYPIGIAVATANLGWAYARSTDIEGGRRQLEEALAVFREIRADAFVFETSVRLAQVRAIAGETDVLREDVTQLIEHGARIDGVTHVLPALLRLLAELHAAEGDADAASRAIAESIRLARDAGAWHDLMLALESAVHLALVPPADVSRHEAEAGAIRARLDIDEPASSQPTAATATAALS